MRDVKAVSFSKSLLSLACAGVLASGVVACGGDSDGSGTSGTGGEVGPTAASGVFLDAEVEGLSYSTDSGITGTTDENGTYTYLPGETVSFSVGGVNLGSVADAPKCTPFDFAAASTNIARFLQSLDADGDPTNGIDIVAANTALAGTTISSDAFLADDATFETNPDIAGALSATGDTLLDTATAEANLTAGTDDTFDVAELADKVFVVLDPTFGDIGVMSFDAIGTVSSVFPEDTTAGGGDGAGFDENWTVGVDGVLTLTSTGRSDPTLGNLLRRGLNIRLQNLPRRELMKTLWKLSKRGNR